LRAARGERKGRLRIPRARASSSTLTNYPALINLAQLSIRRGELDAARTLVGRYNKLAEPTSESLWLGGEIERKLGDSASSTSYATAAQALPGSKEYQGPAEGKVRVSDTPELQTARPKLGPGRTLERLPHRAQALGRRRRPAPQVRRAADRALEAEESTGCPGATFVPRDGARLREAARNRPRAHPRLARPVATFPGKSRSTCAPSASLSPGGKRGAQRVYLFLSLVVIVVVAGLL